MTASALPVDVSLHPGPSLDFGACPTMQACTEQLQVSGASIPDGGVANECFI